MTEEQQVNARMIQILASKIVPSAQHLVLNMLVGALTTEMRAQNMLLTTARGQAEGELHKPARSRKLGETE